MVTLYSDYLMCVTTHTYWFMIIKDFSRDNYSIFENLFYRVTIQLDQNLPLTLI